MFLHDLEHLFPAAKVVSFYTQLKGSANIVGSDQIVADAKAGALPALAMGWHDSPYDEHPVADVSLGQGKIWQAVDAIASAGLRSAVVGVGQVDGQGVLLEAIGLDELLLCRCPCGEREGYDPAPPGSEDRLHVVGKDRPRRGGP